MQLVLVHYALYCFAFLLVQERGTESGGRWYQLPEMYRGQQSEMPPWLQVLLLPALCTATNATLPRYSSVLRMMSYQRCGVLLSSATDVLL